MIWFWLYLSKPFIKVGNYFYNIHVKKLRIKQGRS